MQFFALLGGSGSGKTALSLDFAKKFSCAILSLDSLSIYQEIDIASAKPSPQERAGVVHFGIDVLKPNELQNVQNFIAQFQSAKAFCKHHNLSLLLVGGSSFYLKALLCGISELPKARATTKDRILDLGGLEEQFMFLQSIDPAFSSMLKPQDSYRITRALEIFFDTDCIPSLYFKEHPPRPFLKDCVIFEILLERQELREKIAKRTELMLKNGLIDEVRGLISRYGEAHQWAKSIGIKEVLAYQKGAFGLQALQEQITTHTAQLAKRQRTFNKTQFSPHFCGSATAVQAALERAFVEYV